MYVNNQHLLFCFITVSPSHSCGQDLGLQSGLILDSQISSSLPDSNPHNGRLNHPLSAWCFLYSKVHGSQDDVFYEIDLGSSRLVSGFQSQGPPSSLHDKDYMRYISLTVEISMDYLVWADCCSQDGGKTNFYADDTSSEVDKVRTHPFHNLVAARYIRIKVSTGLRWLGHDQKCFRFEILGCGPGSEARSNLTALAEGPGYLSVNWSPAVVNIPGNDDYQLHDSSILLNMTYHDLQNSQDITMMYNTSDTSMVIPNPMWGTVYHLTLTCVHQHILVKCGQIVVKAQPEVSPACRAHSNFCSEQEEVMFLTPRSISATHLQNTSVAVTWKDSSAGWRAPEKMLRVEEKHWAGKTVLQTKLSTQTSGVLLTNLSEDKTYQLVFYPQGPNIPADIGQVAVTLALLRKNEQLLSFIGQVGLQAHIVWSGRIRVSWELARARGEAREGVQELLADEYKLVLKIGQGDVVNITNYNNKYFNDADPEFVSSATASSNQTSLDFTGVELGQLYTIYLTCIFGQVHHDCGATALTTRPPDLVVDTQVYSLIVVARTWGESNKECMAGEGHLISLGDAEKERRVMGVIGVSDIWTGGNMCHDSPG